MRGRARFVRAVAAVAFVGGLAFAEAPTPAPTPSPERIARLRREIAELEALLPSVPDRGAVLCSIARNLADAGEMAGALARLKQCVELDEGFDPSVSPRYQPLHGKPEFDGLVARAREKFPPVSRARLAFTVAEKDLIPEGLAFDGKNDLFYMGSIYRCKIVRITRDGKVSDLFPAGRDKLFPIVGVRVDPSDATIWAATSDDDGHSELIHVDRSGRLIGRYAPPATGEKSDFNDLAVRQNGEVFVTDYSAKRVYRFDPAIRTLSNFVAGRTFLHPNGIAFSADFGSLFVADDLGVRRIDMSSGASVDIVPAKATLSRIDGLYWHRGSLVAVQNGIGPARVVAFRLSADQNRVTQTTVLEYRTPLTDETPTTGAVAGEDFYFISNSQVDNIQDGKILDPSKLSPIRIGVVRLP
ncbi:MAG TPA: hypothetical protein VF376_04210 [Thermoanaerobaculia bacterium]